MLEKFSLKSQILGLFVTFTTITLLVVGSVAISNFNTIGETSVDTVSDSMVDQISEAILQSTEESGLVFERIFDNLHNQLVGLVSAIDQVTVGTVEFGPQPSYFDLNTTIPDLALDADYGRQISKSASSYFLPTSDLSNLGTLLTGAVNASLDQLSNMDTQLEQIHEQLNNVVWSRIVLESSGLIKQYPASVISADRSFDARTETWYTQAKLLGFTDHYISTIFRDDTNFDWLITISKPIITSNGDRIGVVAFDYAIGDIQDDINDIQHLNTGYASLIENDGTVIAHPDWVTQSATIANILQLEIHTANGTPALELDRLTNLQTGQFNYYKNDEALVLSYTSVTEQMILLSVFSQDELLEVVDEIQADIVAKQQQTRTSTIILSVITFILILAVGFYTTDQITKPIGKLTELAHYIARNVTERDAFKNLDTSDLKEGSDEVGDLTKSFKSMIESIKEQEEKKK